MTVPLPPLPSASQQQKQGQQTTSAQRCGAPTPDGPCGAWRKKGRDTCFWHGPEADRPQPPTGPRAPGPEQCGAPKKSGGNCLAYPIPGAKRCWKHGGRTKFAKQKVKQQLVETMATKAMAKLGLPEPTHITHTEALIWSVSAKYAEVCWLREKVQGLSDEDLVWGRTKSTAGSSGGDGEEGSSSESEEYSARVNIWWQALRSAEDQLVKYATAAHSAGVADAQVDIAKQQGVLLSSFVDGLMAALSAALIQAGVTREGFQGAWEASIGELFPAHFRAIGAAQSTGRF